MIKGNKHELDSWILSTFLKLSTVTLQLADWLPVKAVKCTYSDTGWLAYYKLLIRHMKQNIDWVVAETAF